MAADGEEPVQFPELKVPPGVADVLCKYCRRSKYTTPNTTMPPEVAIASNQLTLRWRRERGTQCAPCYNYQAKRNTPEKYQAAEVSCCAGITTSIGKTVKFSKTVKP